MPIGSIDPASLEGDDLLRWYRRTPWDIEQERQAALRKQYNDFFGTTSDSGNDDENTADSGAAQNPPDAADGANQPAPPTSFPAPSFGPNGHVPGLLGDLGWLNQPQQQDSTSSRSAPQSVDPSQPDQDQTQIAATDASAVGTAPNSGVVLDRGLWPTGTSPTPMPLSSPQSSSFWPTEPQTPPRTAPNGADLNVSPRPSDGFISWLFGGPVPVKGPNGMTVGYYDHQAANAGFRIIGEYARIAPFFQPGSWAGDFLGEIAPGASDAIGTGIDEGIANHHPWPKYLGGSQDQELEPLRESLHRDLHSQLGSAMRQEGFPPVGGVTGSTPKWAEYFAKNPGSREQAIAMLRKVTADFDRANGTSISSKLEQALQGKGPNTSR